jgi:hypothetical protein
MEHHYITEIQDEKYLLTNKTKGILALVFVVGLILAAVGAMNVKSQWNEHDGSSTTLTKTEKTEETHAVANKTGHVHEKSWVTRVWANFLMNSYYFMLFAVGALFFIAVNYVANAGWSVLIKRIAEAMSGYLPFALLTIIAVLAFGKNEIYHWYQYISNDFKEGSEGFDKILNSKMWFLNKGYFLIGVPAIICIWILFRTMLRRLSLNEDKEGGVKFFNTSFRYSAAFIFIFAFSFSILSWMLMMSIDAHWFSTIFSVYNFAITFVTGVTVIMFFTLYLKSQGYLEVVPDDVIHDLGKYMFAFSIFWGYIWLSQFLLIWYANLPEEAVYFNERLTPQFKPLFLTNVVMNFALPFLILMMRNAKRNPTVLMVAGSIILLGHWLDMYLMVMPGSVGEHSGIGLLEIGTTVAFAGIFIFIVLWGLSRAGLYPKNHPYILESANHDVGV